MHVYIYIYIYIYPVLRKKWVLENLKFCSEDKHWPFLDIKWKNKSSKKDSLMINLVHSLMFREKK